MGCGDRLWGGFHEQWSFDAMYDIGMGYVGGIVLRGV